MSLFLPDVGPQPSTFGVQRGKGTQITLNIPIDTEEVEIDPYCVVLADDHVLFRQGLKKILAETKDFRIIGEAGCGLELINLLKKLNPDMVILDISMPKLRGIEAIREIKMIHPHVSILILTMHKDNQYLHHAISAGAQGYLLKEDAATELFSAIETIRKGKIFVSPLLTDDLTEDWAKVSRGKRRESVKIEDLTHREREVLKLIAEGKSSKEVGELLFISARTVERHRANMMLKLNMKKTADLVKYAIQKGYI